VREGNFAGGGVGTASAQTRIGNGVVRGPERPRGQNAVVCLQIATHRVNLGGFEGFVGAERW